MKFGIGQAVTRLEDRRLLTGGGKYTDDTQLPGCAYAYVLRSPHANALLKGIDATEAKAAPGVLAVLTVQDADADGLGDIPCLVPLKSRDGSKRANTPRPVLARGQVRHVGDAVALVVAESLAQARDAAELVMVDYEETAAVVDTVGATKPGAPQVWAHIKDNLCFDWEMGDSAAVEAAFAGAAKVARVEIVNNRVVVNSMEPRGAVADYDAQSGRSTLYTSTQGPHVVHGQLADVVLKTGKDKLRVITNDVGGGFGMKIFCYPEQALTVWASRRLKRPVKWTPDRSEAFMSDIQGRDNVTHAEAAMDGEGRFLALRFTTWAAMGAYLSNFGPFIPTGAGAGMQNGLYAVPAIYVSVKGVMTNTVPTDAYRGAGRPEAAYMVERLVDHAGRVTGLGAAEIRRRNFIKPEQMPYKTALGDVYDSGEFEPLMAACMERADWSGFEARRAQSKARGKLRGIGLATYVERCSGGQPDTALVRFEDDDTVTLLMSNQSNGQGHQTLYTQVLSDQLGIDAERIRVVQGDTDRTPNGMTGGSRAAPVGGAAVMGVADKVKSKGKQIAAHLLEAAAVDIEYADGSFTVAGTDRAITLFDLARKAKDKANLPEGVEPGLDDDFTRTPEAATFPNGCHITEIEVDPETGVTEILRYTVVDDFGGVVNPIMLMGQVHGGIVQGVGQALYEHTVYEEDSGQLLTGSFMDYAMPRADAVPMFDFTTRNVRCTTNPLGIKGAGEAGAIGAPPAVINALVDALAPATGLDHIDMPATPAAVWRALQARRAA